MKTSRTETSIRLMRRMWLTAMESARRGGVMALAQRVSELRGDMVIIDKWVDTPGGARVKAYRIVGTRGWTTRRLSA